MNSECSLVTCTMLTYKKFNYLYEALDSVFNQDYPNIELIIGDDCSPEFSRIEIEQYIETNKSQNISNVVIYTNDENLGIVKNINKAFKMANGDYLIGLSGDDVFYDPNVISKVVKRFRDTGWELMTCRRLRCKEDSLEHLIHMPPDKYLRKIASLNTAKKQYLAFARCHYYQMASGSVTYQTKKNIERFGYYSEDYTNWEDGPFFARYTRNGNIIHTAYDIVAIKYREGGISTTPRKQQNQRNNLLMDLDMQLYYKKEIEPFIDRFNKKEIRKVKYCKISIFYNKNKFICILKKLPFIDIVLANIIEERQLNRVLKGKGSID